MYTRVLDDAQVQAVALEPTPLGTVGDGLCSPPDLMLNDGLWTDFLGNGCSWYRCSPSLSRAYLKKNVHPTSRALTTQQCDVIP